MKIVVIDARRTPIAKSCSKTGIFRRIRADTLSGTLLGEIWRGPLGSVCDPSAVIWGCARQHAELAHPPKRSHAHPREPHDEIHDEERDVWYESQRE